MTNIPENLRPYGFDQAGQFQVCPLVHLNGTPRDMIIEPLTEAYSKLGEAYQALKQTAPNGRDYYCHPLPNALELAQQQHTERLKSIDNLRGWIERAIENIEDQIKTY